MAGDVIYLPVNKLRKSKWNPRIVKDPEKFEILIESIKREGIKYPLLVRKITEEEYEVLDGSRRLEAAKRLGMKEVPCKIIEEKGDKEVARMSLRIHLSQEDLTPEEIVNAILNMIREGIYESEREACEDQKIPWRTWIEWKKEAKIEEKFGKKKVSQTVSSLVESAEIDDETKEELIEALEEKPLCRDYVKEIVDRLEENPELNVEDLIEEYSEAEPREIDEGVYEAKGKYLYRLKQSGQNVVFELVDNTMIIGSISFPKRDLVIVRRLFQKL